MNAARRLFAVLDVFSHARRSMTLSEISQVAGLPLTTTHRLVRELVDWGGLERDGDEYRVGLRMFELGALAPRVNDLVDIALPHLQELCATSQQDVRLGIRVGTEAMIIARVNRHGGVPLRTRTATRLPLTTSAVGLCLLAYAPGDVLEFLSETSSSPAWPDVVPTAELAPVLARVRRNGFAIRDRSARASPAAVAAPVLSPTGRVLAAVTIDVRGDAPAAARALAPAVRLTGQRISQVLARPLQVRPRT